MAVPDGFQSSTRPVDTFVKQSTVAGITYTGGLNDVATALAKIEPTLNKFIVSKIKEIKEEEVAEAQTEGEQAARRYTKTQRLLFPQGVEIDETSPEFAETVAQLSGKINENDRKIYQGKSIWYKNAFEEAKAIRLGKTYSTDMLNAYDTYRVKDPVTGIEKPLSAYPFTSPVVQDFISTYRNKNVELAAISEFHFQRSFLPEIQKGTEKFITQHETDHAAYKLQAHKTEVTGGLEKIGLSWQNKRQKNPSAKFEDIDFTEEKEGIKFLVENAAKFYQGKDLSDFYKDVFIPYVNETGIAIANDTSLGENRFDLALQWIEEIPQLFPKQLATKKVINKDGSVSIENIPEPVFLTDKNGDLILDEATQEPIQKYEVVENADGSKSTIPVVTFKLSDKTVLENKQNYLKEKNNAIKKIRALEKDYIQFGKEKELIRDKTRMKEILVNAADRDLTENEKTELNEIIAKSDKARKWLENNRNTYRSRTYDGGLHLRDAIENGQYRERNVAEAAIEQWWNNSLKLPADKKLYNEMIGQLDTEIDEERLYAIQYSNKKSGGLKKIINNISEKSDNGLQILDTSEDILDEYERSVRNYAITKHDFGDKDANDKPILRYPNKLEIEDFANSEFLKAKDQLTSTLAAIDDQNFDLDALSEKNLSLAKEIDRKSFSKHIFKILRNPPTSDTGQPEDITLDYVLDTYDIKDIDGAYFFDQYKNSNGEYNVNSTQLENILKYVSLTDEQINAYGLIDVYRNSSIPELQQRAKEFRSNTPFAEGGRGFSLPTDYTETEKEVFEGGEGNSQVVTPQDDNKNIEKTTVSDETTNEKEVITDDNETKEEVIEDQGGVNTNDEIKNPKNMKLSNIDDVRLAKIFTIPQGVKDGDLLATGEVPFPIGAGENFGRRFNLYLQQYYGFDTDSRMYKQMPAYMKVNLMESFQQDEATELAETQKEIEDNEIKTTGDMIESLDLSEVQSDMTPNLGLRDGSLIAMNLPVKGKENKKQEDTEVVISKDPNAVTRMETNFKTIYAIAKKVGIKFPEVVAAQFGVESDHGMKVTGKNNYLGIKARPEDIESGNFTEADTYEEIDGKMVKVRAKFKNFTSIEEMLLDYKKHYNDDWFNGFTTRKGTVNVNTAEEAIIRLKENGYATDSDYVKLVTDVLNDARREPPLF